MAILAVRVTPRSARPGIGEWREDSDGRCFLEVRVAAAPSEGAANLDVIKLLAKALDLPKSAIVIQRGASARLKRLEVPLDEAEIRRRLTTAI